MSQETKNNLLRQGTILALAGILVRVIGMFYRIPLANIVGDEGNGIYSVAFNAYNIALILSSYGLPMAVSKMVSATLAKNEYQNTHKIFVSSLIFASVTGGIAAFLLFAGANWLARYVYTGYEGIELPLRVLAPTVFIVAILGVVRGFFQGHGNMVPTAVSQVFEQIVNAIVSIVAAVLLVNAHKSFGNVAAYGAMGATFGTCFGAATALLCVLVWYMIYRKPFMEKVRGSKNESLKDTGAIYRMILFTTIPIILGQTFYQISALLDDIFFGKLMAYKGLESTIIAKSSGVYNSIYVLMISIPMGVASALASSALPSIVKSFTQREDTVVKEKIHSVIKFNMMIAIPSTVGLMVIGEPIVRIIFSRLDYHTGGMMLKLGGFAVIFYALSTVSSSVLQALDRMKKPVIHSAISLVIHMVLVCGLLMLTDLRAYALVIGYMTFPIIIGILNFIEIYKVIGYRQEWKRTFGITGLCSVFMGICTYFAYSVTMNGISSTTLGMEWGTGVCNLLAVVVAMIVAMVTYFASMYAFHNIERP